MEKNDTKEAICTFKDLDNNFNIALGEENTMSPLNTISGEEGNNPKKSKQETKILNLKNLSHDENDKDVKEKEERKEIEEEYKQQANNNFDEKKNNNNELKILREHKSNEPFEKRLNEITKRQMKKIQEAKSFKEISQFTIHKLLYKKIYPQILEKAILMENERLKSLIRIDSFELILNYKTEFGFSISVSGSSNILGKWADKYALGLDWNEGHFWNFAINTADIDNEFEYKYVIQDERKNIIKWEGGNNRKLNLNSLTDFIKKSYDESNLEVNNKFNFSWNGKKCAFNKQTRHLVIEECWQI